MQIRNQHRLREDGVRERNIALALDEEIVKGEMERVEPFEKRRFRKLVYADKEIRNYASDDSPGKCADAVDVFCIRKDEDENNGDKRIYERVSHGLLLLAVKDAVIIRKSRIPMGDRVNQEVRNKAKNERENGVSCGLPDHCPDGSVSRNSHRNLDHRLPQKGRKRKVLQDRQVFDVLL